MFFCFLFFFLAIQVRIIFIDKLSLAFISPRLNIIFDSLFVFAGIIFAHLYLCSWRLLNLVFLFFFLSLLLFPFVQILNDVVSDLKVFELVARILHTVPTEVDAFELMLFEEKGNGSLQKLYPPV